eukprot:jgi/Mesvir1/12447/Mv25028-RA.1
MESVFEIPVVFQGLRPGETYFQLLQSLSTLDTVCDAVLSRINEGVQERQLVLRSISQRLQHVQAAISTLEGSTKAVVIHSPAQYPLPAAKETDYVPLFAGERPASSGAVPRRFLEGEPYRLDFADKGGYQPDDAFVARQLFVFYSGALQDAPGACLRQAPAGLGKLPRGATSVADISLFNGRSYPYLRYEQEDNLSALYAPTRRTPSSHPGHPDPHNPRQQAGQVSAVRADVYASSNRAGGGSVGGDDQFAFVPGASAAPSLQVPSTLPNLGMVADVSWTASPKWATDDGAAPPATNRPDHGGTAGAGQRMPAEDLDLDVSAGSITSAPRRAAGSLSEESIPRGDCGGSVRGSSAGGEAGCPQQSARQTDVLPSQASVGDAGPSAGGHIGGHDAGREALLASIRAPGLTLRKVPATRDTGGQGAPGAASTAPSDAHPSSSRARGGESQGGAPGASQRAGGLGASSSDPRAELMAAIQSSNVRLRKVSASTKHRRGRGKGKEAASQVVPPPAADMFSEMASALALRRLSLVGGGGDGGDSGPEDGKASGTGTSRSRSDDSDDLSAPVQALQQGMAKISGLAGFLAMKDSESKDADSDWD